MGLYNNIGFSSYPPTDFPLIATVYLVREINLCQSKFCAPVTLKND